MTLIGARTSGRRRTARHANGNQVSCVLPISAAVGHVTVLIGGPLTTS
jgi:hypothetical protein